MNEIDRQVLKELEKSGPLSHDELEDNLGLRWDHVNGSIRKLRHWGKVCITIDRRYKVKDSER